MTLCPTSTSPMVHARPNAPPTMPLPSSSTSNVGAQTTLPQASSTSRSAVNHVPVIPTRAAVTRIKVCTATSSSISARRAPWALAPVVALQAVPLNPQNSNRLLQVQHRPLRHPPLNLHPHHHQQRHLSLLLLLKQLSCQAAPLLLLPTPAHFLILPLSAPVSSPSQAVP